MNNTKVIIGFPEITEIRIGTAIRVAILSYVKYNDRIILFHMKNYYMYLKM